MGSVKTFTASAAPCLEIVAIFDQSPEAGGGFHQSLNSLAVLADACAGQHRLRALVLKGGLPDAEELVTLLPSLSSVEWITPSSPNVRQKILLLFKWFRLERFVSLSPSRIRKQRRAAFIEHLDADVVYFLSPNDLALSLVKTPYVMTVWDVCHLDYPEFPEVRAGGEFDRREIFLSRALPQALLVVTDSDQLSERIHHRYGVDRKRLIAQGFRPSPCLFTGTTSIDGVLEFYKLEPGYWFYPAQFWAHKNHVRVLEALVLLRERGIDQQVVFSGSDQGFRADVVRHAHRLGMSPNVRFLGFVPSEHLRSLYLGSIGLVFPSYFGPTNLPPLEALKLGKPVVCSDFHELSLGSAACYFAPDDHVGLADHMEAVVRERDKLHHGLEALASQAEDSTSASKLQGDRDAILLRSRLDVLAKRLGMLRAPRNGRPPASDGRN